MCRAFGVHFFLAHPVCDLLFGASVNLVLAVGKQKTWQVSEIWISKCIVQDSPG